MKPEVFNFERKRKRINDVLTGYFERVLRVDPKLRNDEKTRTGMLAFLRELGPGRNMMFEKIKDPSDATRWFVDEKSSRTETHGHASSQNSEDVKNDKYRGCIAYHIDGKVIHSTISGMLGSEDALAAVIQMSEHAEVTVDEVIDNVKAHDGQLPEEFFQEGHYLKEILDECRSVE